MIDKSEIFLLLYVHKTGTGTFLLFRVIAEEDYSNLWRVPMSLGAPRSGGFLIVPENNC